MKTSNSVLYVEYRFIGGKFRKVNVLAPVWWRRLLLPIGTFSGFVLAVMVIL